MGLFGLTPSGSWQPDSLHNPANVISSHFSPKKTIKTTVLREWRYATDKEMQHFVSNDWVAVGNANAKISFKSGSTDVPEAVKEEFNGNVPASFRTFYAGATCNHRIQGVWFEGDVMHTTKWSQSTLMGCGDTSDVEDKEVLYYVNGSPKVLFGFSDSTVYLQLPNGDTSEWQIVK